jgi:diguanylate cyclase (GGDEF)-like protein
MLAVPNNSTQPEESVTKVPVTTTSMAIPALPPWGDGVGVNPVRDACVILAALSLVVLCLVHDLPWTVMGFIILIFVAAIFLGWYNRRHMAERHLYETKLCKMTIELGEKNKELKELIQIDPLTEVLNRRGFDKALTLELSRARRQDTKLFAMLLDCDDFKTVNDRFGHAVGDVVLQQLAKNLLTSTRVTDYAARIGGDEFMVLLVDLSPEDVAMVAERVRLNIAESSVICGEAELRVTTSVGVAQLPTDICTIEEVLNLTRSALKASKEAGKNRITLSSILQAESSTAVTRQELGRMVQTLVGGEGLRCVRQPIHNLKDQTVVGYEVLTRGPIGPFEMPSNLFRLAKDNDVLTALDVRCFRLALAVAKLSGQDGVRYHLNMFPGTLLDFPHDRLVELFRSATKPLCLEINEQQHLGKVACLLPQIAALKECGIAVALDDVGQSRSSLESLLILEPDVLKIHPELIRGCSRDSSKYRQIERMLAMATSLKTEVIAEGVETQEDLDTLVAIGITRAQGYFWGQPEQVEVSVEAEAEAEVAR